MSRLQKKCLVGSALTHALLLLVLVSGTAFFTPQPKPVPTESLRVVPTKLIDDALSGGGGNPKAAPSEAQQKGQRQTPPQPRPPPPRVEQKKPEQPRPAPKPEVKVAKAPTKPAAKPAPKPPPKDLPPIELKPITSRDERDAVRAAAEARSRELAARQAASRINRVVETLQRGFEQGTVVETHGPGGEAYANYAQFVKAVYEDAWVVTDSVTDEDDATATVSVTIARSGHVVSHRIVRRSGHSILDRSVQRALDKVKFVAPFPEGAREDHRTFTINFNLKAKQFTG